MHAPFRAAVLAGAAFFAATAFGQPAEIRFARENDLPDFFYDTAVVAAPDSGKARLWCTVKVAFDELQFLQVDGRFRARYELSAVLADAQGRQLDNRLIAREVFVSSFDSTNSRTLVSSAEAFFDLAPGTYELILSLMDVDSKKAGLRKRQVAVALPPAGVLSLGDPVWADRTVPDSSGRPVPVPSVVANFSDAQDTLFLWFEVFAPPGLDSTLLRAAVLNPKGEALRTETRVLALAGRRTVCVLPVARGDLKGGRYRLDLAVGSGKGEVRRSKPFSVHWTNMPSQADNLDKAVEQLQYIARGGELKKLKKLEGEEKLEAFKAFWREKDPSPGTESNELMEEYYRRIEYSDQNFGGFRDGWKTDRGMIYTLLGPPSEVERHPFDSDAKPYEIWTYYTINRYFLFVDHTGLGDYRLEGPASFDALNRIR